MMTTPTLTRVPWGTKYRDQLRAVEAELAATLAELEDLDLSPEDRRVLNSKVDELEALEANWPDWCCRREELEG